MCSIIDIEELTRKADDMVRRPGFPDPTDEEAERALPLIREILQMKQVIPNDQFDVMRRRHKFNEKKSFLFKCYLKLLQAGAIHSDHETEQILRKTLQIKPCKSWSGIVSITIFTSPYPVYTDKKTGETKRQTFSCGFNCSFCPNEPGQPRSYLKMEPGVMRANRNGFDCADQIWDRMTGLYLIGHIERSNKLEIIVSGGTWTSYPEEYREEFCRDVFYAANTFWEPTPRRSRKPLAEEKAINEEAACRVVGLTIETRPDTICDAELVLLRYYGCTRVQLGIQHVDDDVLNVNNRRCPDWKTINAIRLLKRNGFKIDAHFMPNLPGSNVLKDRHMFLNILLGTKKPVPERRHLEETWELAHPEYQVDQWKVYPTAITPFTDIERWYKAGRYVQYSERELIDLLITMKSLVFPWIRLNRIIRDIPRDYIYNRETGSDNTGLRMELLKIMEKDGTFCQCIRCREVKSQDTSVNTDVSIVVRKYNASEGHEYFISAEAYMSRNPTLYGFVRLRLDDARGKAFPELEGAALIRELHVYGSYAQIGEMAHSSEKVQHRGIGKTLMARAEHIAQSQGYGKIAVISSEGTRGYYKKLGYENEGHFMTKTLVCI
jgi:ELP3 family radical SAM enzyme/protein acetyltransferase